MKKCPSSVRCSDSNPQPLQHESPAITTRSGFLSSLWPSSLIIIATTSRLVPVSLALHDHLSGVDCRRISKAGTASPEYDHPDAPPMSKALCGRILWPRKEHDPQGLSFLTKRTIPGLFYRLFRSFPTKITNFQQYVWKMSIQYPVGGGGGFEPMNILK